jgi:SAM-dependent methyltransferase
MSTIRRYASWLRRTPFHPQWLMPGRTVSRQITACQGRVLDIGAADGRLAKQLDASAEYISLDYPATAIGLYGTRPLVFADACAMPFAEASFDAVACYEVLEHVSRPDALLEEVARVLVPGGVAEFTMPFLYPIHDAPHDYQRWTRHGWSRSLAKVGLLVESIEPRGHSLHAAGVTACLGMAGPLQGARLPQVILGIPVLLVAIPVVNLVSWTASYLWPSWDAMSIGYHILVRKPNA